MCERAAGGETEYGLMCPKCEAEMRLYVAAQVELEGFIKGWTAKWRALGLSSYQLHDHLADADAIMWRDAEARGETI